jgi:uncharacterized protein YaaQ
MGLIKRRENQDEFKRRHARSVMSKAAYERLETMTRNGILSEHVWESLEPPLTAHTASTAKAVRNIMHEHPEVEIEEYEAARREALTQQRSTLSTLFRDGIINEEVFSELTAEIDQAQTDTQIDWQEATHQAIPETITEMLAIVIQEEDINKAVEALERINAPIVRMPSTGEFLGRRSTTLLIGIFQNEKEYIIKTLQESVQERVAVWQPQAEGESSPTSPAEVTIGATLFSFDIERYEEL